MHRFNGPLMDRGNDWGFVAVHLLFWLVVVFVIAYLVLRYLRTQTPGVAAPADPLEVARLRYASGEIAKKDYDQLVKDLK